MKAIRVLIGTAIALAALYFTVRGIDLNAFTQALTSANWLWFVPAAVLWVGTLVLRAARWSAIMGGTPFGITFHAMSIGYMMNMLLPGRIGEIGRAFVIGQRTSLSMSRALGSVVVERLLDLATVMLMLAASTLFVPLAPELLRPAAFTGVLVVVAVFAIGVLIWRAEQFERLLLRIFARIPRINATGWIMRFRDIVGGFRTIGSGARLGSIFALTLLLWVLVIGVAYTLMSAFLPARLDAASLMVIFANLGGAIPTPGGLGPAQYLARLALEPFGSAGAAGVAFVLVWSLAQILALIVIGLFGLARLGMSLAELRGVDAAQRTPTR
jgi:glycosyltransferase 2 family protein